ncbi:OmpH family outer membrane protein [Sediminitomix flava]|uniref:Periplasmic chaperone for outer membrane proteins Skp n=1 Tax=Sediminitomix flava TaxID=379075 RepID=A0A315ZGF2_SEDFL|nr:OmpH family outer membrane protein [Sediminitomix flava]PWJ44412.1 periplasmic chaperone for outer membrane proteins Skp [Sediminitomix flava]
MKLRFIFALVAFLAVGMGSASAQTKFGYVDLDSVIRAMPEYQTQMTQLESYGKQLEASFINKQKEFEAKYKEYVANRETWVPLVLQEKERELQQLDASLKEFQQKSQQDMMQREQAALIPMQQKAVKGIEDVAKEAGYSQVLPITMLLFNNGKDDITGKVIEKVKVAK